MINTKQLRAAVLMDEDIDAIDEIIASWRRSVVTDSDYAICPDYIKVAFSAYAFYTASQISGLVALLADQSCGHRLKEIMRWLAVIGAHKEVEWLEAIRRLLPGEGFPTSPDAALRVSDEISQLKRYRGVSNPELYRLVHLYEKTEWKTLHLAKVWIASNLGAILDGAAEIRRHRVALCTLLSVHGGVKLH